MLAFLLCQETASQFLGFISVRQTDTVRFLYALPEPLADFLTNRHLMTAIFAAALAQILKTLFDLWRTGSWKNALLTSTGGMPSSHSAITVALMVSVGLYEGFGTPLFAVSTVLAMVVMHDAAGIRRAAGKQAEAINFLFSKLESQGIKLDSKLKELLGHRPIEVMAGAVLGFIIAIVSNLIF